MRLPAQVAAQSHLAAAVKQLLQLRQLHQRRLRGHLAAAVSATTVQEPSGFSVPINQSTGGQMALMADRLSKAIFRWWAHVILGSFPSRMKMTRNMQIQVKSRRHKTQQQQQQQHQQQQPK